MFADVSGANRVKFLQLKLTLYGHCHFSLLHNRNIIETFQPYDGGILQPSMTAERHLTLQELTLRPSGEWSPRGQGWIVAHVVEGSGYWLHAGQAREFNPGDGFVAAAGTPAVVRASQLGPLKLQLFFVLPQYLNGLLTVGEGRQLEVGGGKTEAAPVVFNAAEPLGQKFKHIAQLPANDSLALRCALLQLWSGAVAGLLQNGAMAGASNKLRERFREFIGHMSEAELAGRSLADLAREMHCSERHFSRLFREEFGEPLRSRQIELRLQRAHRLLVDSEDKIIHIAFESGYRHLGLFNAMFKKRFGVTPSEWRHQNDKGTAAEKKPVERPASGVRLAAMAICWFILCGWLAACPAGAQTNQVSKPRTFTVKKYSVIGNTVLSPETIARALTNSPQAFGTNVTLDGLRAALADLQMAYRERGLVTVAVGLPQQKLTNGTVKIQVTEGRLVAVNVTGNRYFSSNNVMRSLPSLHTNILLNSHVFQRELDTANASRDRQIYPVISPGPEPGSTVLTLKVKDQLPLHARVEMNNQATPGTPDLRTAFNAQYDNLWNLEHQVGVAYSFTPVTYSGSKDYGLSPFDSPLIANYSTYYRLPLGGYHSVQNQLDANPGAFGYNEVNHRFNLPPATGRAELTLYASRSVTDTSIQNGPSGSLSTAGVFYTNSAGQVYTPLSYTTNASGQNITLNENAGVRLSFPLPPIRRLASTFSFGLDLKRYELTSYNTNENNFTIAYSDSKSVLHIIPENVPVNQPTHTAGVNYFPLNARLNGSLPDKYGQTYLNAGADFNVFPISSDNSSTNAPKNSFGGVAYSANAPVHYVKLSGGADRVQNLYHDWSVKLHVDGQWANGPLFSNEQFGMGGSGGVRGYTDGEAYGDTGWRVSIEPQTPLINIGMVDGDIPFWLRSSVFMDYGEIYMLDKTAVAGNDRSAFWGAGWSLTANIGNHLDGRLAVAVPLISTTHTPMGDVHIYFGVGAQF